MIIQKYAKRIYTKIFFQKILMKKVRTVEKKKLKCIFWKTFGKKVTENILKEYLKEKKKRMRRSVVGDNESEREVSEFLSHSHCPQAFRRLRSNSCQLSEACLLNSFPKFFPEKY